MVGVGGPDLCRHTGNKGKRNKGGVGLGRAMRTPQSLGGKRARLVTVGGA